MPYIFWSQWDPFFTLPPTSTCSNHSRMFYSYMRCLRTSAFWLECRWAISASFPLTYPVTLIASYSATSPHSTVTSVSKTYKEKKHSLNMLDVNERLFGMCLGSLHQHPIQPGIYRFLQTQYLSSTHWYENIVLSSFWKHFYTFTHKKCTRHSQSEEGWWWLITGVYICKHALLQMKLK